MKTILMYTPNSLDGVSLYRHYGPMLELERKGHVRLISMPDDSKQITNWQYFKKVDALFISRPARNFEFYLIKEAQKHGVPVWVDVDDNLFLVPDENDSFEYYSSEEAQTYLTFALKAADVVTVATQPLQLWLGSHFKISALVVPNALDDVWVSRKRPFKKTRTVCWRGSKSHLSDLLFFESEIVELIDRNPDLQWKFYGMNPFFIARRFPKPPVKWFKLKNYVDFMQDLLDAEAFMNFVPLIPSEFNRTRSHNAWLETTLAGMVCLSPDWGDWHRKGIYNYLDRADFYKRFEALINEPESSLQNSHDRSWEQIQDLYLLSKVNRQRLEIINNLGRENGQKR